ncbi:uncharacterized protein LOC126736181 [Anthonomus grandis grandis]|uniref:uncharacterized protein LOC126736181 n=1 Tax=Anthonomus grandis grandis TaxID=2921223 RepID=UPI002165344D|nr:uncharacterized protein LOC126736181 [Anthonomus grandis grandis]
MEWSRLRQDLENLNFLEIKSEVLYDNPSEIQLCGFADASEKAYGACLYLRSVGHDSSATVNLALCAKTKVAAIKSLTIPKLELCAALLLARLGHKVFKSIGLDFKKVIFWSDSSITLAWLKTNPNLLKVFESNRVAEIQTLTENFK